MALTHIVSFPLSPCEPEEGPAVPWLVVECAQGSGNNQSAGLIASVTPVGIHMIWAVFDTLNYF